MRTARFRQAHFNEGTIPTHEEIGRVIHAVATRSDGYIFTYATNKAGERRVYAGCRRNWTIGQFCRHTKTYRGRDARRKRKETLAILDLFAILRND